MKFHFLGLALLTGFFLHAQNTPLVVIGNRVSPSMSRGDLAAVFRGERVIWSNPRLALMKSTTAPGVSACSKIYNMSCDEVTKFWLKKSLEGKPVAIFFNSVSELQAFVARTPGAIGIIDQTPPVPGVQVVLIDGKGSF